MKKSELRSLIREQVKTILNEADMTNRYDGFIILDSKTKKTYKFKYVKGTKNTKVENEAFRKLSNSTGSPTSNFIVHGFVQKGEWNNIKKDTIDEAAGQNEYNEGDLVKFKDDKEVWQVVKAGMRNANAKVQSNEVTIKPYDALAKRNNVSVPIDITIEYLNANTEKINESINEAYGKPAGLTKDQTLKVAQKFATAMSKAEGAKVTVNQRTLEEDSFDLDYNGEEFDGGSYNIYQNGNVMNMADNKNPVVGKVTDSVDVIAKNFKKMISPKVHESVLKETFIGPFVFTSNTPEKELQAMYHGALDGYANYKTGMKFSKADYKLAYQTIEKLLKKKGVAITEAVYHASDDEFIEEWVSMELADESDATIDRVIADCKEEWKEAARNYANVRSYLMDLRKNGDLLGESEINEAKGYSFTFNYNTDDDDIKYIQKLLDRANADAVAQAGLESDEMVIRAFNATGFRKAQKAIESDGFQINEADDPEAGEAAPYGSGYSKVNEDAGMVVDVAMGVAVGLMGLWALVQSAPLVGRVFGDAAEYLANKSAKKAKLALKDKRKETIAPIIAKFKNDKQLADMYQNLTPYSAAAKLGSSQAGLKAQQGRVNQLTKIGNYIKTKLTPDELVYFRDISAMLRDGDIKESVIKEEITLNSPSFKKLVIYLQKISDENGNDWKDLVTKLKSKYAMLDTYTSGTNEAAYVVNFFSITKGKDASVKKKPQDYVEIGEWYTRPW